MNLRYKLYVEGLDDMHVTCQLALKLDILCEPKGRDPRAPKFLVCEDDPEGKAIFGVDHLIDKLPVFLQDTAVERLGFVVDADDAPTGRWDVIRRALIAEGYSSAPNVADPDGTIVEQVDRPRIGVWIMPDNRRPGIIENFIEQMIPSGDQLLPHANRCVDEAIAIDRRFPDGRHHRQKAVIHTWLAWQKKAGRPQGLDIRAGYLDASFDLAQKYIAWLVRLFG